MSSKASSTITLQSLEFCLAVATIDQDTEPRDHSTQENSASQTEGTPGEFPAEAIEEHSPAPDSGFEVSEEVPPEPEAVPETSDHWAFTSTIKKRKKAKRPIYDWD